LEPEAYGVLGLSPEEFGRLTMGEYIAKARGHRRKQLNMASLISLAFNDPKKLAELDMLERAFEEGGG